METWSNNWDKFHKGCNGRVVFIENVTRSGHEWNLRCLKCNRSLYEEEVEFIDKNKKQDV